MTVDAVFVPYSCPPNDQDQRGEPEGMDGGTAIVEASAESTCWAATIIRGYFNYNLDTPCARRLGNPANDACNMAHHYKSMIYYLFDYFLI